MNKELAKQFHDKAFSRWAKTQPIDIEIFMQLVVDECIRIIENTKGPSKLIAVQNIRKHFGYPQSAERDESVQV